MNDKTILIKNHKNKTTPLVCLTAYTAPIAQILDKHCDIILVGDSVGTALYGMDNTLGVTLDMMINHGKAVMRRAKKSCVVVDMPYATYEDSIEQAYNNALKIMNEAKCDAIKLEGGQDMATTIQHLTKNNIPVMAHIGLQPQSVIKEGGYKIKGRTDEEIAKLLADARAVEGAGAFSIVIEGTIEHVSQEITNAVNIPTIGIGASNQCDGQILVTDDMLGLITDHVPKFVKKYADLSSTIDQAAQDYAHEVKRRIFPQAKHTYKKKS